MTLLLTTVRESQALPSWARKYGADCSMCHYAAVPRLNSFGLQFRRAGYRTPIEFGKDQDVTKVGNFLSGRLRVQFDYANSTGRVERSEIRFPEAALFYAGAFSRNFSGYIHALAENSTSVTVHGHLQGVWGSAENFFSVRVGQMHMLLQQGVGGFDRPTVISPPPIYATPLTRNSTPMVFHFDQRQKAVELSYVHGPGRVFTQISNGLDNTGSGTASIGDVDPQKDVLIGYDYILDDIASGFTVFYYNGTVHATVTPSAVSQTFAFSRFGANLSKIFPVPGFGFLELQGGFVRSYDNVPIQQVGGDVEGNAFYIESQQYITGPEVTFLERFSLMDLDGPGRNSTRKDYTLGVVKPLQTWLRVAGEYTYTDNRFAMETGHLAVIEVQGNW